jgi:alpha-ribazole phosphatase/probable phosphoglycerate mutase
MKIILIRHGQTQWNNLQKYQGHKDIPLNDFGRKQALKIANYLHANENIEALYCSDLSRTRETADIIGKRLGLNAVCDLRLREINFGKWEGMTFSEVYKECPDQYNAWYNNTIKYGIPGGESFTNLLERAMTSINDIKEKHKCPVAVVTHGGVIKAVLHQLGVKDILWGTVLEPGSLTILEIIKDRIRPVEIGLSL